MFVIVELSRILFNVYTGKHYCYVVLRANPHCWKLDRPITSRSLTLFLSFRDSPVYWTNWHIEDKKKQIPKRYLEYWGVFAEIDARHDKAYILSSDARYERSYI